MSNFWGAVQFCKRDIHCFNLILADLIPLQGCWYGACENFFLNFIAKIRVNQLILSQGKFGVLNGALVRIALLMFIV